MPKQNKRVLIIAYYWPPSGGSGVQRWVKFVKYLRSFEWEPVIYTPSNPEYPEIDHSLEKDIPSDLEVIKQPIREPYTAYKKFVGLKKEEKLGSGLMKSGNESSFLQNLSLWIRGNFFIPDARKFWIKPSVSFLKKYLKDHPVDAIVSTGPPHSMHLIALGLKSELAIPWIADFRDPWTNIDFYQDLKLSSYAHKKHLKLEKKVLDECDKVVVISPSMKSEFEEITSTEIDVITNGFDSSDFERSSYKPNDVCVLSHVGMMTPTRNPEILWQALSELSESVPNFKDEFVLRLIGKTDVSIEQKIADYKLSEVVELVDYVPHDEIISIQQQSEGLLLIINNTPNANLILTGKMFEYLAARRPIICISPLEGDVKGVLNEANAGVMVLYSEKENLKSELYSLYRNWKEGTVNYNGSSVDRYSRENLTKQMSEILDNLVS